MPLWVDIVIPIGCFVAVIAIGIWSVRPLKKINQLPYHGHLEKHSIQDWVRACDISAGYSRARRGK